MQSKCKNCGHSTDGLYCPNCGQKTSTDRFTFSHLVHEFMHGFLHFDHGLIFTAKELALRPGKTIRNYLRGMRVKYFNPFTFILVLGGINTIILKKLHWESYLIELGILNPSVIDQKVWHSALEYFTIRSLLAIPIYSFVSACLYYKKGLTFIEHLVANTYMRGEICFFLLFTAPQLFFFKADAAVLIIKYAFLMLMLNYTAWSYAGLFNEKYKTVDFIKGFIVSLVAFSLEMTVLQIIITQKLTDNLF